MSNQRILKGFMCNESLIIQTCIQTCGGFLPGYLVAGLPLFWKSQGKSNFFPSEGKAREFLFRSSASYLGFLPTLGDFDNGQGNCNFKCVK